MIINKAYVFLKDKKNISTLEEMIKSTFSDIEFYSDGQTITLSTLNNEAFHIQLVKLHHLALSDMNMDVSFFIVPFFDKVFYKYFKYINNEVCTAYEVFSRNVNVESVKKDCKEIVNSISKKDLDTIQAFLMCNGNSCITANELYLHRNSFNYRMNSFINNTSMDIRDLNTIMFIKLILSINK